MNRYIKLSLSIFLLSILFLEIFNLESFYFYTTKEVTAQVKSSSDTVPGENVKEIKPEVEEESREIVKTLEEKENIEEAKIDSEIEAEVETEIIVETDKKLKIAYLTFDDGPSIEVTPSILDILKEYDIKATFFVIGKEAEANPELLLRMKDEGHMIANHTYTHNYKYIYAHPQNFLADLKAAEEILKSILGNTFDPTILRFPGGSFGKSKAIIREAVTNDGYQYVDWNVVSGDAEGSYVSVARQLERIKETLKNKEKAVVLMHDNKTKQTTVDSLTEIIEYIMSQGYVFRTLEEY